jgi:membrane-associated HD superfamily phosphohydrolase
MSEFNKNMEKIFDVAPVEVVQQPLVPVEKKTSEEGIELKQDLKDAYEQTKDNLQEFIDNGKDALDELIQIAKAGQHPRAFEVYSGLLKNLVDANKELLNVQKQMRDMDGKKQSGGDTKIDKAVFFNGTTADLNKLLKGKQE